MSQFGDLKFVLSGDFVYLIRFFSYVYLDEPYYFYSRHMNRENYVGIFMRKRTYCILLTQGIHASSWQLLEYTVLSIKPNIF